MHILRVGMVYLTYTNVTVADYRKTSPSNNSIHDADCTEKEQD